MFSHLTPGYRFAVQALLAGAWATAGAGGLAATLLPPPTFFDFADTARSVCGAILLATSLIAATGVILNQYRLEWVAAWFSAAAIIPAAIIYTWYSVVDNSQLTASSIWLDALTLCIVLRAVMCGAHAANLRRLHNEHLPLEDSDANP
jgi:glycerol-3-phosphate acyltransferase PlsY